MSNTALSRADIAQIVEGIEHFIMNGDPEVDAIWQPYIDKLRACADAPSTAIWREQVANRIVQTVAELPDRTSPDDWPEAMLVTADELRRACADALAPQLQKVQETNDDPSRSPSTATTHGAGSTALTDGDR